MYCRFLIVAATIVGAAPAGAADLPAFELTGFPITPHQVAVMGAQSVQEQSSIPTLTLGGMPASPHQVVVLQHNGEGGGCEAMRIAYENCKEVAS